MSNRMHVQCHGIQFHNDEMGTSWYQGVHPIKYLTIRTAYLLAIHTNAFRSPALKKLEWLQLYVQRGSLRIHDGAFDGPDFLNYLEFESRKVEGMPAGLFDAMVGQLVILIFMGWANNVNLNEMFENEVFRNMEVLHIANLQLPQKRFRLLAYANFTMFRKVEKLYLNNLGIEVIMEHAFDVIAPTLDHIVLDGNKIKSMEMEVFRRIFESKRDVIFSLTENKVPVRCSCRSIEIEILICPYQPYERDICLDCMRVDNVIGDDCGIQRVLNTTYYHAEKDFEGILRIVQIRITYESDSIAIHTNFSKNIRMLILDITARRQGNCIERSYKTNIKCLRVNRLVNRFNLHEIVEMHRAEFVSITAIPILYHFGARPTHTITIKQNLEDHWQLKMVILLIGAMVMGWTAGIGYVVCPLLISEYRQHDDTNVAVTPPSGKVIEKRISYDYSTNASTIDDGDSEHLGYEEIVEYANDGNYLEVVDADTAYVAVF